MRKSTNVTFNYGGVQGNSYSQPYRATTNLYSQPPTTIQTVSQPTRITQTTVPVTTAQQPQVNLF